MGDNPLVDLTLGVNSYAYSQKIKRGAWVFLAEPLVRWWPKSFSGLRVFALKAFGARIGPNCLIMPGVSVLMPWNLVLDGYSVLGRGVNVYNFKEVRIGLMVTVSQEVFLCTGSHNTESRSFELLTDSIYIGDYSWVAARAFIGPGVAVGEGCVIGACAVVMRSPQKSWAVYSGAPAKYVRDRVIRDSGEKRALLDK